MTQALLRRHKEPEHFPSLVEIWSSLTQIAHENPCYNGSCNFCSSGSQYFVPVHLLNESLRPQILPKDVDLNYTANTTGLP